MCVSNIPIKDENETAAILTKRGTKQTFPPIKRLSIGLTSAAGKTCCVWSGLGLAVCGFTVDRRGGEREVTSLTLPVA